MSNDSFKNFLTNEQKKQIEKEIGNAELKTSGEIRVHIIKKSKIKDIMQDAKYLFKKLKMEKTRDHNGIILIIAPNAKQFAIYGDKGINDIIGQTFWDGVRDKILVSFKEAKYIDGIINAVLEVGDILEKHFPIKPDDVNELSNEITES
jgi:uncharacterized membrane protein